MNNQQLQVLSDNEIILVSESIMENIITTWEKEGYCKEGKYISTNVSSNIYNYIACYNVGNNCFVDDFITFDGAIKYLLED